MRSDKENIIVKKSFEFSVQMVRFARKYKATDSVVAHQLLKSGTSVGANIKEAQNAESPQDFVHKLKIAAKEADESEYWLELIEKVDSVNLTSEKQSVKEIILMLSKIISTTKKNILVKSTTKN